METFKVEIQFTDQEPDEYPVVFDHIERISIGHWYLNLFPVGVNNIKSYHFPHNRIRFYHTRSE